MQQSDALRGDVRIQWYEDGRMTFSLPNDHVNAIYMLHMALDELQERQMLRKAQMREQMIKVQLPKDGAMKPAEWGR